MTTPVKLSEEALRIISEEEMAAEEDRLHREAALERDPVVHVKYYPPHVAADPRLMDEDDLAEERGYLSVEEQEDLFEDADED